MNVANLQSLIDRIKDWLNSGDVNALVVFVALIAAFAAICRVIYQVYIIITTGPPPPVEPESPSQDVF